jgi:hypothetical protein
MALLHLSSLVNRRSKVFWCRGPRYSTACFEQSTDVLALPDLQRPGRIIRKPCTRVRWTRGTKVPTIRRAQLAARLSYKKLEFDFAVADGGR